jgi:hypothetical protein
MAKKIDPKTMAALRADARRLEQQADSRDPYPKGTRVNRPNLQSRLFNVRLSEEQYAALKKLAREKHLPMSTMARAWLLDRLDHELHAR